MSVRLRLTDEAWAEMAPMLARLKSRAGSPPALSDRMWIEAVLYRARTGTPWRDLPEDFGHWDAVYNCCRRWEASGLWGAPPGRRLPHDTPPLYRCDDCARPSACCWRVKKTAGKPHRLWAALGAAGPPQSRPAVAMNVPTSQSS